MEKRNLSKETKPKNHFKTQFSVNLDNGTKDLYPSLPYIISGGKVTERCYFQNLTKETNYKFNVFPEFFGRESKLFQKFPMDIKKILKKDAEAKIFCVFDWDTIFGNKKNLEKYNRFVKEIQHYINDSNVVLCPSMPSFEYWFMLHFKDTTRFVGTCEEIAKMLKPYMNSYFSQKDINLFKVLKDRQYMEKTSWVNKLCSDRKLENAIKRAEKNIANAESNGNLKCQSYSYVYKAFKK